ncbi:MAG: hypothetical protein D6709_07670 [Chloroflexi bacterium]|uniref:Gp5/Type VI secretion system Vgr protein OB-fold domain-containing protein n=1 Tax=Candidatus Thermofonsia Clade 3 bacterium TaxID=2364212 RepID=A0A2M8QAU7_9CHLR|nr:VgrG-related protein [Candidatus Roseilinea sp. NK_OTU-006]PJF46921.1 MAG: hypothetical protein CUN48_11305 [Candidatus Thermofonsia Clade 3 bacterium]RMG63684.1 MAG: hypothetical protein D6709_07670 [Chloroflexota bacterium]
MLGFDRFTITINGTPLTAPLIYDVVRVVVDTSLHMPSMFEIHIAETEAPLGMFKWIDAPMFTVGAPVSIAASRQPADNLPPMPSVPQTLITGEITAVEAQFQSDGSALLVVRGYDRSHRLHRGRKTAAYQMMTDSAIIQTVASEAGLTAQVTLPASIVHEYVLRHNQTDMEFIRERAGRLGCDVFVNELGVLIVKPGGAPRGTVTLKWKEDLSSFSPRLSSAEQVNRVAVQGWDPKTKTNITGLFGVPPNASGGAAMLVDKTAARAAFKPSAQAVVVDEPMANPAEATARATGVAGKIQDALVQADGVCLGNPAVKPGVTAVIAGVGAKFSGPYLITSATHVYDDNGYTTTFHVEGREPGALLALLNSPSAANDRVNGVVIGVVTNNNDPLGLGRVKVRLPHLGPMPPIESHWCRVAAPMAGAMRGFYAIPEVNDEVLVAFEHGDVNYPYVLGALWNNVDRPPKPSSAVVMGGKVSQRIFKTASGSQLIFDDTPNAEKITLVDKTQANSIVIDAAPPGAIKLTVNGTCVIDAKGKVEIKSASQDVEVSCLNFKVTANATIQMKANAQMQLEGTAAVNVKNGGGAQIAMAGPTVNVNNGALEVM